jgi:hypothetical protein
VESSLDSEYAVAASTIEFALETVLAAPLYQGQDHGEHSGQAWAVWKVAGSDGE